MLARRACDTFLSLETVEERPAWPSYDARSLVGSTPFHQCVLGPGELLYIPRHAWHYVRSLETSFSVSFWWGAKMGLRTRADGGVEPVY